MYAELLIIDDSEMDGFLYAQILKKGNFFGRIKQYTSAQDALEYLQSLVSEAKTFPSVILLDLDMPKMNGFDFLDRYIHFPEEYSSTCAIFMLSATLSKENIEKINSYPVVKKFFPKPVSAHFLKEILLCLSTA